MFCCTVMAVIFGLGNIKLENYHRRGPLVPANQYYAWCVSSVDYYEKQYTMIFSKNVSKYYSDINREEV